MSLRVSVTNLETFRLFRAEEWMTSDHLMRSLIGREKLDPLLAAIGTAFHAALSSAELGEHTRLRHGRWVFDLSRVEGDIALLPVRELRLSKTYLVDGEAVNVRGRTDGADGVAVEDHKLRFGGFDAERYAESYQWRFYLDMIGGQVFRYNVFEGPDSDSAEMDSIRRAWDLCPCDEYVAHHEDDCASRYDDTRDPNVTDVRRQCDCDAVLCASCGEVSVMHDDIEITIKSMHQLTLYAYDEMRSDLIAHLNDYMTFARQHLTEAAILAWQSRQDHARDLDVVVQFHALINPEK